MKKIFPNKFSSKTTVNYLRKATLQKKKVLLSTFLTHFVFVVFVSLENTVQKVVEIKRVQVKFSATPNGGRRAAVIEGLGYVCQVERLKKKHLTSLSIFTLKLQQ